jgi:hypothetical protein
MTDPKVEALRYHHRSLCRAVKIFGRLSMSEALTSLHRVCDQLWPPAVIETRYGARRANP